jgi:predicted GNAT family acetyltransferase
MSEVRVVNATERARYELLEDGRVAGFSTYDSTPGALRFVHTEVLPEHAGKGYGSRLAAGAIGDARARGLQVSADCSFIAAYLKKHPEGAAP